MSGLLVLFSLICFGCSDSTSSGYECVLDVDCAEMQVCRNGCCVSPELCGNGQIDTGETCDGDCPSTCDDSDACTTDALIGSAETCNAECSHSSITDCASGDGCCPAGCYDADDDDCGPGFALRLNAGLHSGTSTFGDKEFLPLLPYLSSGGANDSLEAGLEFVISRTPYDELYQRETYVPDSSATFSIPLTDGDYTVHLHFVDWYAHTSEAGERVFDVDIEGSRVLTDFDIVAEAGKRTALVKSFDVTSTGGELSLTLTNLVFKAEIAAVEIVSRGMGYLGEGNNEGCAPQTECDGLCVDTNTSQTNCGACGVTCNEGIICTAGLCEQAICPDGAIGVGESCDDENAMGGDGCSTTCQVESGWSCMGEPSVCHRVESGLAEWHHIVSQAEAGAIHDAQYILVGDSTRSDVYQLPGELFPSIKAKGVTPIQQAMGGMNAYYWNLNISEYSDGRTGRYTVNTVIAEINGTGAHTLVDIDFGINDISAGRTVEQTIDSISSGIDQILAIKPDTMFVITSPNVNKAASRRTWMNSMCQGIAERRGLVLIDVLGGVFPEPWEYYDGLGWMQDDWHPCCNGGLDPVGQRPIARYMLEHLLP